MRSREACYARNSVPGASQASLQVLPWNYFERFAANIIFGIGAPRKKGRVEADPPSVSPPAKSKEYPEEDEKELFEFTKEVQELSTTELDRDLAEIRIDIEFHEVQVRADLGSFTPKSLEQARAKIQLMKRKVEIMEREYSKRIRK